MGINDRLSTILTQHVGEMAFVQRSRIMFNTQEGVYIMPYHAIPSARKTLAAAILALGTAGTAAAQSPLVLEEVIVTAQKRAQSLQDISATVNVVSGENIDKFAAFEFRDVEQQTAGLTLDRPNARNSNISMRGVSTDPEAGTISAVDVYWNDVNVRFDLVFAPLYDLERLEILRGPQGTLQGRTSPAGAINILTRAPDLHTTDGYVQVSLSDNDGANLQAAWGGPVVEDKFAVRVAGLYDLNNSNNVENLTTGLDEPENEAYSARLTGLWQATDSLSAQLSWQYFDREIEAPQSLDGVDADNLRPSIQAENRQALGKTDDFGNLEFDIVNLTLSWQLGDKLELVSVTGYSESEKLSRTENDRAHFVTNPEALTWQSSFTEVDSISQEVRLASMDNDFWDYMAGVYYQDQDTTTRFNANRSIFALGSDVSFSTTGAIPVNGEELGIFTFNTFYLSAVTQLEIGLRWAKYDSFRRADVFYGGINPIAGSETAEGLLDPLIASTLPIFGISDNNEESDEDALTGSVKFRWEVADDVSLYTAYNRGYRRSGISIIPSPNVAFLPNGEDDLLYDKEESDAVELGFKSRLLDGRATLNGAIYYQQFAGHFGFVRGLQLVDDGGELVDLTGGIVYNGDANIRGAELEAQILLTETWQAAGAVSYAKGEWDGAEAPCNDREPGESLGLCDIDGEAISGEPEFSLSLNSEYHRPLENTEWYIRGLYKYTDERDNTDASAGIGAVTDTFDEQHQISLYTGLRAESYQWDISLWVKNLLDEDSITLQEASDQYDIAATGGVYTKVNVQSERTFGLTARYNF